MSKKGGDISDNGVIFWPPATDAAIDKNQLKLMI